MTRLVATLCVLLAACGGATVPTSTTAASPTTKPAEATTTRPEVAVDIQDCDQPPVTFSAFCETYDLIDFWHVDQPLDAQTLASLASEALSQDFSDVESADLPRVLPCAIPNGAFTAFCHDLAALITAQGHAVGPVMDRVLGTMIEEAFGPFTYYLSPDQVTAFRENGLVGGVGLLLDATNAAGSKCARLGPSCPLRIVVVLEDNPGKAAGLAVGDVIVAVDHVAVDGQGFAATSAQIAGDETGTVTLTIYREGESLDFEITRDELVGPSVTYGLAAADTAYLRIPDFESDVPDLVTEALAETAGSWSTMVVDLRDNPGGLVSSATAVASEFIPDGTLFQEIYSVDSEVAESLGPGGHATGGRLIVLVNEGTASAAEILAGALRDRRGALLVGTPTFGKDAIQIRFDLRNGGRLNVVVARWLTPDGTTVGNGGLVPDVELELPDDMTIPELVDAALEAAR